MPIPHPCRFEGIISTPEFIAPLKQCIADLSRSGVLPAQFAPVEVSQVLFVAEARVGVVVNYLGAVGVAEARWSVKIRHGA